MAKTLKVMLIDSEQNRYWKYLLETRGYRIELVRPETFCRAPYEADEKVCQAIRSATADDVADVIVLGNNMGAGLKKAPFIVPPARAKTIVVSHDPLPERERGSYAEHGYVRYATRLELADAIAAVFDTN